MIFFSMSNRANRYNLVCVSDAMCECGEGSNSLVKSLLYNMKVYHEQYCQEGMSVMLLDNQEVERKLFGVCYIEPGDMG